MTAVEVHRNRALDDLNSFGFSSTAEHYAEAPDEATLLKLLEHADARGLELFVLGGGSNLVLTGDVSGLVVRLTGETIAYAPPNPDGGVRVVADAGLGWDSLVRATLQSGLGGLENLSLIPGTVGAAPVQNIGAYGVELDQRLVGVRAWHRPTGRWRELTSDDCAFGYRDSRFKRERGEWIITSVTLELGPQHSVVADYGSLASELARRGVRHPTPRDVAGAVVAVRRSKLPDPTVIGNAGSFFHNPIVTAERAGELIERFPGLVCHAQPDGHVKLAAGWLIDQLGFRGHRENGVGVHERQALVLVNTGDGNGAALMSLADRIADGVRERYGVELVVEPLVL